MNLYHGQPVTHLDLSYNRLKSVEGLSLFKHLESLVLDNNKLTMIGGGFDEFSRPVRIVNSSLKVLSLNNNRITNLESFLHNISTCFPNLSYLSLLRNPCCPDNLNSANSSWQMLQPSSWLERDKYADYRRQCIRSLPRLQFLDSSSVQQKRRGGGGGNKLANSTSFEKLILNNLAKFKNGLIEVFTLDSDGDDDYNGDGGSPSSPLPQFPQRNPGEHYGVYVKNRTRYIGKQSEGNRFIGNGQL